MTQERTKLWNLKNFDLFSQMRKDDCRMVDRHSRLQDIKRGEALCLEGAPDTSFSVPRPADSKENS